MSNLDNHMLSKNISSALKVSVNTVLVKLVREKELIRMRLLSAPGFQIKCRIVFKRLGPQLLNN